MNIFVLDSAPQTAARYHCDRHVVKMINETTQMLVTAHAVLDDSVQRFDAHSVLRGTHLVCAPTHPNHVCNVWLRVSSMNYAWLHTLGLELLRQYERRYSRRHAYSDMLRTALVQPPTALPYGELTPHAQAMPERFKHADAVHAYRLYYAGAKLRFARWRHSEAPPWLDEYLHLVDSLPEPTAA